MKAWRIWIVPEYIEENIAHGLSDASISFYKKPEDGPRKQVEARLFTLEDLAKHNEKIARAALETGFAQGYSREGFGSKQEYEEYVEMKLSDFLQSPEYKELVGE